MVYITELVLEIHSHNYGKKINVVCDDDVDNHNNESDDEM